MSKVLKISKHKLDLAQVSLTRPTLLIGRSPMCDQILRAPGILPVHFLLEWVGEGEFNPNEGMWTLFNMEQLISRQINSSPVDLSNISVEGLLVDDLHLCDLNWEIVEDRFKATTLQKGIITERILSNINQDIKHEENKFVLEIVEFSKKDQSVDGIWHFYNKKVKLSKKKKKFPFEIDWKNSDYATLDFHENAPELVLNLKGASLEFNKFLKIYLGDTYILHYKDEIYFARFVSKVQFTQSEHRFYHKKFLIYLFASFLIFFISIWSINQVNIRTPLKEVTPKLRIVKIVEVTPNKPNIEAALSVKQVEEAKIELPKNEEKIKPQSTDPIPTPTVNKELVKTESVSANKSAANAPSYKSNKGKLKAGLNSPATVSNVNSVGLLGKLKSQGIKGSESQITADRIVQTHVNNIASGQDGKGILIQAPKMAVLSNANSDRAGADGDNSTETSLIEAKTTLKGAREFNADNSGNIAVVGGLKGKYTLGSGLGKSATDSVGSSEFGNQFGGKSGGDGPSNFSDISGGLSKTQVLTVINSHKRGVRACFESALRMRNDLNGILRLKFVISGSGEISDIKIVNTELPSSILENCLFQLIRQMKFPAASKNQSTTVFYPFFFKRSS